MKQSGGILRPNIASLCFFSLLVGVSVVAIPGANASWTPDGVPVSGSGSNYKPSIISDGAGGSIIAWHGGVTNDIFAQRLTSSGAFSANWPASGALTVCAAPGLQEYPVLVSDLAGGALIFWQDARNGSNYDIVGQHISGSGQVFSSPASNWLPGGIPISGAVDNQYLPVAVSDGSGGAIVVWQDLRHGTGNYDIYSQRVDGDGNLLWPPAGNPVCLAANNQINPTIVSDGAHGAYIAWQDYRKGSEYDIYVQHIGADGLIYPSVKWSVDGIGVCVATNSQYNPALTTDSGGGVFVAWQDTRSGTDDHIFAQHLSAAGAVLDSWPVDGRPVCQAQHSQYYPVLASDGSSGAYVAWQDYRSGTSNDIYAQHLAGAQALWTTDGIPISTAPNSQVRPQIVPDGWGGAFITWYDSRGGSTNDIYIQQVNGGGALNSNWDRDGLGVCLAPGNQDQPAMIASALGSVIITWSDSRSGNSFIYAGQVVGNPPDLLPPSVVSDLHAGMKVNGAVLYWTAPGDDGTVGTATSYTIKYSTGPINASNFGGVPGVVLAPAPRVAGTAQSACVDGLNPNTMYYFAMQAADEAGNVSGLSNVYSSRTTNGGGSRITCDTGNRLSLLPGGDIGARIELLSVSGFPNPSHEAVRIRLAIPASVPGATSDMGIFDVAGRRLRTLRVGSAEPGRFDATWDRKNDSGSAVGVGVYFLRLRVGDQVATKVIQLK